MLADINQSALDRAVDAVRADGVDAHGVLCDVRKLDDVQHLADEAFDAFGDVHVVFNNAGVGHAGAVAETSHDDWRFVIDIDLWGPIHGVEAFLPRLIAQADDSHLLFTSSFAGLIPNVGLGPYCVAKYGVVALAETLHRELRANGIGVSVLCPMIVATDLVANSDRVRSTGYEPPTSAVMEASEMLLSPTDPLVGADDVARLTAEAVLANRLYVIPHSAARGSIRRRFERIDRTFDEQAAEGWTH